MKDRRQSLISYPSSFILPFAAAYGFLLIWSFGRVPIPGVNEPHYLTKAKHFNDPEWCAGDLFLESSNPHGFFYATIGQLTRVLSLPQTAVAGRLLGLAVVAAGWQRLATAVVGRSLAGLVALPFFALLQSLGNWSGEWLVGGIESKVFAYGLLFYGIGAWLDGKAISAAIAAGLSASFHPLVGGWGVVAGIGAVLLNSCVRWFRRSGISDGEGERASPSKLVLAAILSAVLSLPGLLPALATLRDASPEQAKQADYLQVAGRLAHHLDPMTFLKESHRYFGMEIALWLALMAAAPVVARPGSRSDGRTEGPGDRGSVGGEKDRPLLPPISPSLRRSVSPRWRWFVASSLLIAAAGVLLAAGPRPIKSMPGWEWRIGLMKFYPFRLADVIVPVAVSLSLSGLLLEFSIFGFRFWIERRPASIENRKSKIESRRPSLSPFLFPSFPASLLLVLWLAALAGTLAVILPGGDRNPSNMPPGKLARWIQTLEWVKGNTPADAVIYSLGQRWAVRWYAQRPEYVNYKDCPQDAVNLLEWNRRLWVIAQWNREAYVYADGAFSAEELAELRSRTGIDYLICTRKIKVLTPEIYGNDQFAVYSLEDAAASQ